MPAAAPVSGHAPMPSGAQVVEAAPASTPLPQRPAVVSTRRSSALPWAAAVLALIGSGAGAAWYFQHDRAPAEPPATLASASVVSAPAAAPAQPPAAIAPETPAPVRVASVPEPASADVDPMPAATVAGAASAGVAGNAPASVPPQSDVPDSGRVAHTDSGAAEAGPLAAEAVPPSASGQAPRASAPRVEASPQSATIGARLAEMRERRERREAHLQNPPPRPSYAKAVPAPVTPTHAGPPRVLVVGYGDPAVAGSAELAIEERLGELGLDIVDEDFHPALAGVEDRAADLMRVAATAGNHVEYIVVVRVVPMGEQLLTFYGESMTQYTARVEVGAYDMRARRKIGPGWSGQVSFTHLNADPNTRQAIAPMLARLAQGIGRGRG